MTEPKPMRPKAVLVGVHLPDVSEGEHASSLAELSRLVHTLGYDVVGQVSQRRSHLSASAVVGAGKLKDLALYTDGVGVVPSSAPVKKRRIDREVTEAPDAPESLDADDALDPELDDDEEVGEPIRTDGDTELVAVDHDLTPTQARNLERATGATVMDRSAVILEIFHRHARSREARLQVEIARLNYLAPRLREGVGGDRQRGGIGGKGAGESALELDRRRIRDRVAELRRELDSISHEHDVRRARRKEQLRVALVGYTNAGKSSLMRALTGSEVYVADKLFATLDTTVRTLHPPSAPKVLVSDTVGFIKKLPHDLVASFRSTLDEAREASLLLHVVDGSDPAWPSQHQVTRTVLEEIHAGDIDTLLVINKADRIADDELAALAEAHPDAVLLSAKRPDDVARLRELILSRMEAEMDEATVDVPFGKERALPLIHESCRVIEEAWDERGGHFRVRALPDVLARLKAALGGGGGA
ncbi:MAG: GTPase HflX [Polyangiales bacterium]